MTSPFWLTSKFDLERVAPVEHHIHPVAAETSAAIRRSRVANAVTQPEVVTRSVESILEVRCVIPQYVRADAHARCDEIPQVPLTQQDTVAPEVVTISKTTNPPRTGLTSVAARYVGALKVRAD